MENTKLELYERQEQVLLQHTNLLILILAQYYQLPILLLHKLLANPVLKYRILYSVSSCCC